MASLKSRDSWTEYGVGLITFLAYAATLPQYLPDADSGEWILLAQSGGVPHPSGYPLYALLLRFFYLLAAVMPLVTGLALLSALCGASAACLATRTLRRLNFDNLAAAVASLAIFLSYPIWHVANTIEPFALNLLICMGIVYVGVLAIKEPELPKQSGWMGLLFGIAATNHHSAALMLPFALLVFEPKLTKENFALLGRFIGGLLLGLLPYLYLLQARRDFSPFDFYPLQSVNDFLNLVLRTNYGTFQLAQVAKGSIWSAPFYFILHLPAWLSVWVLIAAGFGLWSLSAKIKQDRRLKLTWLAAFLLSGVFFLMMFRLGTDSFYPTIIERFLALPMILLIWPAAQGIYYLRQLVGERLKTTSFLGFIGLLLISHIGWQSYLSNRHSHKFFEHHALAANKVASFFGGGVMVAASDAEISGYYYSQDVRRAGGDDMRALILSFWDSPYYRARFVKVNSLPQDWQNLNMGQIVENMRDKYSAVYVADLPMPPLPPFFNHGFPLGAGYILLSKSVKLLPIEDIIGANERFYSEVMPIPSCDDGPPMSSWDFDVMMKYVNNLELLATYPQVKDDPKLEQRVLAMIASFKKCRSQPRGHWSNWLLGHQ